jgi:hypothetical protein
MKFNKINLTFSQFLRFLTKIEDYSDSSKCWIWKGSRSIGGYGQVGINHHSRHEPGTRLMAHRVSYTVLIGEIPEGKVIDHRCRVRACVNPWHMEVVTQKENTLRGDTGKHHKIKTHCPKGHEFTTANTYHNWHGGRFCRKCAIERARVHKQKKKLQRLSVSK